MPKRHGPFPWLCLLLTVLVVGCFFEPADGPADGEPKTIGILITADDTRSQSFADGLSGQTVSSFTVGLSEYLLLTHAHDAAPVRCFVHDEPVEAVLDESTLLGSCQTAAVPSGVYTHGRVRIDWIHYTVDGALHDAEGTHAGQFWIYRAFSDTTFDGQPFDAGQGVVRFQGPATYEARPDFGPPASMPGVTIEQIDGQVWMTFPYSMPLPIDGRNEDAHWAEFHWQIFDGYRWMDASLPGFSPGIWDVSVENPASTEIVVLPGVTGYYVTSSIDPTLL